MNEFLIALVILEFGIDIFWSIKYYKLFKENRALKVQQKLLLQQQKLKILNKGVKL